MSSALAIGVVPRRAEGCVTEHVGNTPLVRLRRLAADFPGVEVFGKAEFMNPGGSVKDRAALNMILEGERSGALDPTKTILDASSGNTAIAYAMIGASRGYRTKICIPANASLERTRTLEAYGAELVITDPDAGSDGAIGRCREICAGDPGAYFYADQYNNAANWQAHFNTTGLELIRQTRRRITHFVAILGTSGTFMGTSRRLKQDLPEVECVSVQPTSGFHGIEGAKHMETARYRPGIYDPGLADRNLVVETEEAYVMARRLAKEEGLLVGISAGANVTAALQIARELVSQNRRGLIVAVLCDQGGRYLSEEFWRDSD
jgi:cysteine synthase B